MEKRSYPLHLRAKRRSLIMQVAVSPIGRELLDQIYKSVAKFFTVPKVLTAWEEALAKRNPQPKSTKSGTFKNDREACP